MIDRFTQLVSPARCGGCGDALPLAMPAPAAWCEHCRVRWGPVAGYWNAGLHGCDGWAAAAYHGPVRRCILAAKAGAPGAAAQLLRARLPAGLLPAGADVTWVPGHPLRTIGIPDAGQALAQVLVGLESAHDGQSWGDGSAVQPAAARAAGEGLTLRRLISRSPTARRQAGRSTVDRGRDAHRLGLRVVGRPSGSVVVVDDVRTTGTTLDWAARQLQDAGAERVLAITVALAPSEIG